MDLRLDIDRWPAGDTSIEAARHDGPSLVPLIARDEVQS